MPPQILQSPKSYPKIADSIPPRATRREQNVCRQQRTERTIRFILMQRASVLCYEPPAVFFLIVAEVIKVLFPAMYHAPIGNVPGTPRMYRGPNIRQHCHARKNERRNQPTVTGLFPIRDTQGRMKQQDDSTGDEHTKHRTPRPTAYRVDNCFEDSHNAPVYTGR